MTEGGTGREGFPKAEAAVDKSQRDHRAGAPQEERCHLLQVEQRFMAMMGHEIREEEECA